MSTLNVDALVGVSSANAITVRGEGSATTSLQQGLAKSWTSCTDNVIDDSLNTSSSSDGGTGAYTITVSNNFATANVAANANCNENSPLIAHIKEKTASTYLIRIKNAGGSGVDANTGASVHGDLA